LADELLNISKMAIDYELSASPYYKWGVSEGCRATYRGVWKQVT